MLSWADNNWMRVVAYFVVAVLCVAAGRRQQPDDLGVWRPFWPMTAAVLLAMAVGPGRWDRRVDRRPGTVGGARRRVVRQLAARYQAVVVGAIGAAWVFSVLTACWRIPERRRRYLPMMIIVMTIGAYVAIRMVSLHQVDSLLYRRDLLGMRIGTLTEYALLAIAGGGTFWTPTRRVDVRTATSAA